jgi:hypothetical protein
MVVALLGGQHAVPDAAFLACLSLRLVTALMAHLSLKCFHAVFKLLLGAAACLHLLALAYNSLQKDNKTFRC